MGKLIRTNWMSNEGVPDRLLSAQPTELEGVSMTMFIAGLATAYAIPLAVLVVLFRKAPSL
jgi:hypothetical protein